MSNRVPRPMYIRSPTAVCVRRHERVSNSYPASETAKHKAVSLQHLASAAIGRERRPKRRSLDLVELAKLRPRTLRASIVAHPSQAVATVRGVRVVARSIEERAQHGPRGDEPRKRAQHDGVVPSRFDDEPGGADERYLGGEHQQRGVVGRFEWRTRRRGASRCAGEQCPRRDVSHLAPVVENALRERSKHEKFPQDPPSRSGRKDDEFFGTHLGETSGPSHPILVRELLLESARTR